MTTLRSRHRSGGQATSRRRRWPSRILTGRSAWLLAGALTLAVTVVGRPLASSQAVINGSPVGSTPSWAAAYEKSKDANSNVLCSGVLISSDLVLTAAHCLVQGGYGIVAVGRSDLTNARQGQLRNVVAASRYSGLDLAVLLLESPVSLAPISIAYIDPSTKLQADLPMTIYGYGRTTDLSQPAVQDGRLRSAVGLQAGCPDNLTVPKPRFCLVAQSIQAPCQGDSGGALVTPKGRLIGIYTGRYTRGVNQCEGAGWLAVPTGNKEVRAWIDDMIDRHGEL